MKKLDAVRDRSRFLDGAEIIRRWCRNSVTGHLLANERFLQAAFGVVLLVSLINVLGSNMATATKFLSFALLSVITTGLTIWILHQTVE